MSSTILLDRGIASAAGAGPHVSLPAAPSPVMGPNYCMVPRCTVKFEQCKGGFKIECCCEDEVACGALQNLCKMLAGSPCCCSCTWNGATICQCNLACGNCKCEYTADGVCITCTSGDKTCCEMLQACCDCLSKCCQPGCCCYISLGGTPICCCIC